QQLTALFQNISATLEFGRRLAHFHRYQKLALDDELKRMEDQMRAGDLIELQAVKPILQDIYDDSSVMNVVRARAQRLMRAAAGSKLSLSRFGVVLLLAAACALLALPAMADSQARIVRLSDVQGSVQIDKNTGLGFERAFLNLPITQGAQVKTHDRGRAEIE